MRTTLFTLFALAAGSFSHAGGQLTANISTEAGDRVADAVVSVTPLDPGWKTPPAPEAKAEIDQIDQEYRPYVTPVLVGTTVEFPNEDTVQHHLYSVSPAKRFEKPLYASGSSESVTFDKPGVVVLGCNIHDWMSAYVVVLETPYFGKSDNSGSVTLDNLPEGDYRLEVWHPRLPKAIIERVTVSKDETKTFEVKLRPDRRIRRSPTADRSLY